MGMLGRVNRPGGKCCGFSKLQYSDKFSFRPGLDRERLALRGYCVKEL
jgi:hypothetical protein